MYAYVNLLITCITLNRVSSGITFEDVPLDYLDKVNDTWRFPFKGSREYFKSKILYDTNVAVFNEKGENVAFVLK